MAEVDDDAGRGRNSSQFRTVCGPYTAPQTIDVKSWLTSTGHTRTFIGSHTFTSSDRWPKPYSCRKSKGLGCLRVQLEILLGMKSTDSYKSDPWTIAQRNLNISGMVFFLVVLDHYMKVLLIKLNPL
jgi:hypothetical protein